MSRCPRLLAFRVRSQPTGRLPVTRNSPNFPGPAAGTWGLRQGVIRAPIELGLDAGQVIDTPGIDRIRFLAAVVIPEVLAHGVPDPAQELHPAPPQVIFLGSPDVDYGFFSGVRVGAGHENEFVGGRGGRRRTQRQWYKSHKGDGPDRRVQLLRRKVGIGFLLLAFEGVASLQRFLVSLPLVEHSARDPAFCLEDHVPLRRSTGPRGGSLACAARSTVARHHGLLARPRMAIPL